MNEEIEQPMSDAEFNKRFLIYKKQYTEEVDPPNCTDCNEVATLYDPLMGENFCESCLKKSLKKEPDELREYTDAYMASAT